MKNSSLHCLFLLALQSLAPEETLAQATPESSGKFEFTIALSANFPFLDSSYATSYSPPFRPGPFSSSAGQTLNLIGQRNPGLGISFSYLPDRQVGFQFLTNFFGSPIVGRNSPYRASLEYTAQQPPDFSPRRFTYERSLDWPETEGSFRSLSLSSNLITRLSAGNHLSIGVSGGPTLYHLSGAGRSLGFSDFFLGGHSVLFVENHRLEFDLEPANRLGFNAGGELDIRLGKHVGIAIDSRYFYCPTTSVDIHLSGIVNPEEVITTRPLEEIERLMSLERLELEPSFFRLQVGLQWIF